MLDRAKTVSGYKLSALDGEVGSVKAFYFDDKHWTVRYLVAETGGWLTGRQVLISPYALNGIDHDGHTIRIDLTKKQIEDSPPLDTARPVSRQYEQSYYDYYDWPTYWSGPFMWGPFPTVQRDRARWANGTVAENGGDPHLRSTAEVDGYHIQASDGEMGHVEDFVIDDQNWAIRYLVVNTRNWWPGKKVLISPQWIDRVSWDDRKVFVNVPRDTIKQSPEYSDEALIQRDYETRLYGHYNRRGYWVPETVGV